MEEKKELEGQRQNADGVHANTGDDDLKTSEDSDSEDGELVDLPAELKI